MWQNSEAEVQSVVKIPSVHSHIPISVLSSSDDQKIHDTFTCPDVFVVGLGLKSVSSTFQYCSKVYNNIIYLPNTAKYIRKHNHI